VSVLALLPFVLTLAVPDWYFASPSGIDPWLYHGFFRHLDLFSSTLFPNTYYGTRLGWILPGHAAYALFAPFTAAFVLHVTFYLVAVASMYCIVRWIADRGAALGVAVAFGLLLPSFRGLGDDYVAAGVVGYVLLSTALAVAATRFAFRGVLAFGSGAAAAAMFHSNIVSAFLVPTILVWLVPASRDRAAWSRAGVGLAVWLAGAVICTLALGELSVRHGGRRLFFVPSFTWMLQNSATNPWDQRGLAWVLQAPWAFVPAVVALACAAALLQRRRRPALDPAHIKAVVAFAYIFGVFLVWDLLGGAAVLYWPFYTAYLMPAAFVALAAVVIGTLPPARTDALVLAAGAGGLIFLLSRSDLTQVPYGVIGVGLIAALAITGGILRRRALAMVPLLVVLAYINVWASVTRFFAPYEARVDVFRTVDRALAHIAPYTTTLQPRFLYNEKDAPLAFHYNAIAGTYLWGYTIVTRTYPTIEPAGVKLLPPDTVATLLSSEPQDLAGIAAVLAPHRLAAELVENARVDTDAGPLHLTFFRVRERADTALATTGAE
jgi:hypothetical protein